jgi:hypothetical protein
MMIQHVDTVEMCVLSGAFKSLYESAAPPKPSKPLAESSGTQPDCVGLQPDCVELQPELSAPLPPAGAVHEPLQTETRPWSVSISDAVVEELNALLKSYHAHVGKNGSVGESGSNDVHVALYDVWLASPQSSEMTSIVC